MKRELQDLIQAYEAARELHGPAHRSHKTRYTVLVDDALGQRPGMEREAFERAIHLAWLRWNRAQEHPPTLPPTA